MNVLDFAMKLETDAEAFYRKMARENPIPGIRKIFEDLADDEKTHFLLFQKLKTEKRPDHIPETGVLERTKNAFAQLLQEKERLPTVQDDLEAYRYVMRLEAEGAKLYLDAAKREKDVSLKKLLEEIAAEEEKHFNIVDNIYQFINAPSQYLAWGEFSNIDEFRSFGREVDL